MSVIIALFGWIFIFFLLVKNAYVTIRTNKASEKFRKESNTFNSHTWSYRNFAKREDERTPKEHRENCKTLITSYANCHQTNGTSADGFDELFGIPEDMFENINIEREFENHILQACKGRVVDNVPNNFGCHSFCYSKDFNITLATRMLCFIDWINKQLEISGNYNPDTSIVPVGDISCLSFAYKNKPEYKY